MTLIIRKATDVPSKPASTVTFTRQLSYKRSLRELWKGKELIRSLAERDLRVRYKQATLGMAWTLINPIILLVAFTVIFERAAHINTGEIVAGHRVAPPYPLFAYIALLPWGLFSESVGLGAQSIVSEKSLLNKVQFPRETFVIADITVAVADLLMASIALVILFIIEGYAPKEQSYWVLICLPIVMACGTGVALAFSALVVHFRDMAQLVSVILQLGLFATPVAYSMSIIPHDLQPYYAIIDPLGPALNGIRQGVLYGQGPWLLPLGVSLVMSLIYLIGGYMIFKRMEMGFADIA